MYSMPKINPKDSSYQDSKIVVCGIPFDGTVCYRPGTRFGPKHIRNEFYALETYSPFLDLDLTDYDVFDIGDMDLPIGDTPLIIDTIFEGAKKIVEDDKIPFFIGGEHLVSFPCIKAVYEKYKDLYVIHLDAHTDTRDVYFDNKLSHANIIRRCWDFLGDGRIYQFGIRSGSREEFYWSLKDNHTIMRKFDLQGLSLLSEKLKDKNVYVTVDLDVLDPSIFPGTGTPEAGGITYKELEELFLVMCNLNIVGADIVELAPDYDKSGVSTAVAAKVLREMMLSILKNK